MIKELNREKEFRKRNKRFRDINVLFESFIKKYSRRKKLKKAHLTKNKKNQYMGEVIFTDMILSFSYTKEEIELLFQCLISMPLRSLYNFEQLYIKSSKSKLRNHIEALENHQKDSEELHTTADTAYRLYNENIILEDKNNYLTEKWSDKNKKYGKYDDIYREYLDCLNQSKETRRGFKKQIIYSLIDKYYKKEDILNLSDKEYDRFKLLEYKKIKSAFANRIRHSP